MYSPHVRPRWGEALVLLSWCPCRPSSRVTRGTSWVVLYSPVRTYSPRHLLVNKRNADKLMKWHERSGRRDRRTMTCRPCLGLFLTHWNTWVQQLHHLLQWRHGPHRRRLSRWFVFAYLARAHFLLLLLFLHLSPRPHQDPVPLMTVGP